VSAYLSQRLNEPLPAGRRQQFVISVALIALMLACQGGTAVAQAVGGAQEVGRFGDWVVLKHMNADPRTCFAASQPVEVAPQPKSGTGVFYVTAWPSAGIKLEPSVTNAGEYRAGSAVTITIGRETFSAFTADGSAYIADLTAELKLIDAMRKGSTMTVEGLSTGGVRQRAVYSLKGVTQALTSLASAC
jgi:Invasion associated locus B (IalB) protein